MADKELPVGKLYIDANALLLPKWMIDAAISAGNRTLIKFRGFDGYLRPSESRRGDFSLLLGLRKPDPFLSVFIGIPGINKTPIVQEIYLKED